MVFGLLATSRDSLSELRSVASQESFQIRPSRTCTLAKPFGVAAEEAELVLVLVSSALRISVVVGVLEAQGTWAVQPHSSFAPVVVEASSSRCRQLPAKRAGLDQTICALAHPVVQVAAIVRSSLDL